MKQKSENQKAFPRFLGILVVASLIGGVLGGLSGVAGYFWEDHTAFGAAFAHLLGAASPWAMAACAAVLLGLGLYQYRKSNTAFHGWDGEDEDVMQRAEERLSWALLLDSLTVIVSFFFFSAGTVKLPQEADSAAIGAGVHLDDGLVCQPAELRILTSGEESEARVILREGKFHQIKRMLAYLGKPVLYLERVRMGNLLLDPVLERGAYRLLTKEEWQALAKLTEETGKTRNFNKKESDVLLKKEKTSCNPTE